MGKKVDSYLIENMGNHQTTTTYSDSFRTYLAHTDEKPVLLDIISKHLRALSITSLLDIGAGNGDLSIPLAKHIEQYVAVEQKEDYVKRLREAGLEVIASAFPCDIAERFDTVLISHSLPSYQDGITGWQPFLDAAWSRVNERGHLFIVTFEDEESEWTNLIESSGLEEVRQRESRLMSLKDYLNKFGALEYEVITTYVRTKTLDEMQQALAFVWSDGRADRLEIFLQNQEIAEQLETKYKDGGTYSFPFHHYLLDIRR